MTLVYACIAPHGGELIPKLAGPREKRFSKTREAMEILAHKISASRPDTIIIATPHNLRLVENIAVVVSENSTGSLRVSPKRIVNLKAKCDVQLAREILREAQAQSLPVVGANYGTFEGPTSDVPMDWGTLVPLWFVFRRKRLIPRIVIVAPSREIPIEANVKFGAVMTRVLERKRSRRFVFVASADQAHTHAKSGPYGFSEAGARFDRLVIQAIEANRVESLVDMDRGLIEEAKPDSIWQLAMLAGILRRIKMKPKLLSYEVPTYYGIIAAGFERIR